MIVNTFTTFSMVPINAIYNTYIRPFLRDKPHIIVVSTPRQ